MKKPRPEPGQWGWSGGGHHIGQGDVSRALSAGRGPTCAGAEVVIAVWPELDDTALERVERRLTIM